MPEHADTDLKLWVVMNRAFHSIEEALRQQVEAHGISFTEFAVLEVLLHKGALPIGEIGSRVLRSSGCMTYIVTKLEKRGFLTRNHSPEDRRVVYAELTQAGRTLIQTAFDEHRGLLADLMRGLTPEEQAASIVLMKRLGLYAQQQTLTPA